MLNSLEWWKKAQRFDLRRCDRKTIKKPARKIRMTLNKVRAIPNYFDTIITKIDNIGMFMMNSNTFLSAFVNDGMTKDFY